MYSPTEVLLFLVDQYRFIRVVFIVANNSSNLPIVFVVISTQRGSNFENIYML